MQTFFPLLKQTANLWSKHEAPRMGAALAFYSVLSMAPLVVITIAIAGSMFGTAAAQGQIVFQVRQTIGDAGAEVIQSVLKNAHHSSGVLATVVGSVILLISASGVFGELRSSLNRIWDVPAEGEAGVSGTVKLYVFSVAMVLTIGFLMLISLLLSAFLQVFGGFLFSKMPTVPVVAEIFNGVLALVVTTVLFALIYKYVPDRHIVWADVRTGAMATALLFTAGKYLLAFYIAKAGIGSAYGAAGSLIVLLVWVYYSAQIFFFGAEFTRVYAETKRKRLPPRNT